MKLLALALPFLLFGFVLCAQALDDQSSDSDSDITFHENDVDGAGVLVVAGPTGFALPILNSVSNESGFSLLSALSDVFGPSILVYLDILRFMFTLFTLVANYLGPDFWILGVALAFMASFVFVLAQTINFVAGLHSNNFTGLQALNNAMSFLGFGTSLTSGVLLGLKRNYPYATNIMVSVNFALSCLILGLCFFLACKYGQVSERIEGIIKGDVASIENSGLYISPFKVAWFVHNAIRSDDSAQALNGLKMMTTLDFSTLPVANLVDDLAHALEVHASKNEEVLRHCLRLIFHLEPHWGSEEVFLRENNAKAQNLIDLVRLFKWLKIINFHPDIIHHVMAIFNRN